MADPNSRQLQDFLDAAASLTPNQAATPATMATESDDMDYEPATEEDSEDVSNETFLERLMAEGDDEDDEEDDEEYDEEEDEEDDEGESSNSHHQDLCLLSVSQMPKYHTLR